ncbi:outer membrane protein transport protein [Chitinibacter sp. SCUT-21]|uniref:OmpP1/FadL family transporter n=1 Tax=Chitinibacter sp. SCUT-21 TaxID=2970891 RepID=UPI0035A7226F
MKIRLLIALALNLPAAAWASGLYLYEMGTEDVGLASAGSAARAQDASVMAYNPAGLTQLQGDVLTLGVQALYGDTAYQPNRAPATDSVIGWFPGMSAFYSHSVDEDLKLGLGVYGNFGLSMDFGDWAGKSLMQKSTLVGMTVQPTVAYRLNDQWSIGASINANYGIFALERNALGQDYKLDDSDWSHNAKIGLLYQHDAQTRVGLSYTSKTQYEFTGHATGLATSGLPLSGTVNAPQQLLLSAYHQINPQWAVMGNLGWQDWSAYNKNELWLGQQSKPAGTMMRDTWHAAVGVQYQVNSALRLNTGLAFDSSIYQDQSNTSLAIPAGDTLRWGMGAQYQIDQRSSIGAALEIARIDGSSVANPIVGGRYDDSTLTFLTVNYSRSF